MKRLAAVALGAVLISIAGGAGAHARVPQNAAPGHATERAVNVDIPFVDSGAIKGWRSGGQDAILIEARSGRWYRGEFYGDCPDVRASETVAFITGPTGALDRFSRVIVRDRICRLESLTAAPNPRLARK